MDQHKKTSTVHVRGSDGSSIRAMTIQHYHLDPLRRLMGELTKEGKVHVGVEATGFYWWMVHELRRLGAIVHLGHPSAMRLIFKSKTKTDNNDAERLSKLLWIGEFTENVE
jgi:transposase